VLLQSLWRQIASSRLGKRKPQEITSTSEQTFDVGVSPFQEPRFLTISKRNAIIMAAIRRPRTADDLVPVHTDAMYDEHSEGETEDAMDESRGPLEESGCTHSDESEDEVENSVAEDMRQFEESFRNISQRYRLINRIGEGKSENNRQNVQF